MRFSDRNVIAESFDFFKDLLLIAILISHKI